MKILRQGAFLLVLWIGISAAVLIDRGEHSIKFMRMYALLCCYLCIFWPLWFHRFLQHGKPFILTVGFAGVVLASCHIFNYLAAGNIPDSLQRYTANWGLVVVQYSLLFFFCALALLLRSLRISRLHAAFLASLVGVFMMSNLTFSGFLLVTFPKYSDWIIPALLHSNPLVVTAACFDNYDYLRSPLLYESCPIGADYPFRYPSWRYVSAGYFICGLAMAAISHLKAWKNEIS